MASSNGNKQGETRGKYCFAIDRGGTFTDVMCMCPDGRVRTLKLLSEDPARYSDAPREGIRRILKEVDFMTFTCKYFIIYRQFHNTSLVVFQNLSMYIVNILLLFY